MSPRTGGQILVEQMLIHGADTAFCVPGESYLAVTDALYDVQDKISLIVCRQEGGAGNAAEAYGKLTGRPGLCFVTRGPGATNASIAVHTAFQDSTPMILFVGQVSSDHLGREGFQELDYPAVFGPMSKWAVQIDRTERIPEIVRRAYQIATSGRPGPVVVALPEDILSATVEVADATPFAPVQSAPRTHDVDHIVMALENAERPVVVVGGGGWSTPAVDIFREFVEAWELPVITSFRRQDLLNNASLSYAGSLGPAVNPDASQAIRDADVLLLVGTRLGEMSTKSYSLINAPRPTQRLLHVHAAPEELGHVYEPELGVASGPLEFLTPLEGRPVSQRRPWAATTARLHTSHLEYAKPNDAAGVDLDLAQVVAHISRNVPDDTVITNGAGNYTGWVHRFHAFHQYPSQLAPTNGAMGYGLPAALAASALDRNRLAIVYAGDGCLLMNGQELATAVRYELPIIVIIVNNGHYGTIRLHQEQRYPDRVYGTGLTNPDFVKWAESFGAHAERVLHTADFATAFARARATGGVAVIEVVTDPDIATPETTLTVVRAAAIERQTEGEQNR